MDVIDLDRQQDVAFWHTAEDTLDKISARSLAISGHVFLESRERAAEAIIVSNLSPGPTCCRDGVLHSEYLVSVSVRNENKIHPSAIRLRGEYAVLCGAGILRARLSRGIAEIGQIFECACAVVAEGLARVGGNTEALRFRRRAYGICICLTMPRREKHADGGDYCAAA